MIDEKTAAILDEARAVPVWEFMAVPDPARMRYCMACYIDGLMRCGMGPEEAGMTAMEQAEAAISAALGEIAPKRAGE